MLLVGDFCRSEQLILIWRRWIDRKAGLCGFYGSQLIGMHGQGITKDMFDKFERAVYEDYGRLSIA